MRGKTTAIVFDLDSTVRDTRQRHHLMPPNDPQSTWAAYAAACPGDIPIGGTVMAMRIHWEHHEIHMCSDADESAREQNERWLTTNACWWDYLRLRPDGQPPNGDGKIAYINGLRDKGVEPLLAYEDWPPLAARITAETGVEVVLVNANYREMAGCGCLICNGNKAILHP